MTVAKQEHSGGMIEYTSDIVDLVAYHNSYVVLYEDNVIRWYNNITYVMHKEQNLSNLFTAESMGDIGAMFCDEEQMYFIQKTPDNKLVLRCEIDENNVLSKNGNLTLNSSTNGEFCWADIDEPHSDIYVQVDGSIYQYDISNISWAINDDIEPNATESGFSGCRFGTILNDKLYLITDSWRERISVFPIDRGVAWNLMARELVDERITLTRHLDFFTAGIEDSRQLVGITNTPSKRFIIIGELDITKKYILDNALEVKGVLAVLDYPNQEFVTTSAIEYVLAKAHRFTVKRLRGVQFQNAAILDFVYALAAYWVFGSYAQSISRQFSQEDIGAYKTNLMFLKEMVLQHGVDLGINPFEKYDEKFDDYVPSIIAVGRSMVDV